MLEGKPTPAGFSYADTGYSYPRDLARFVRDRWRDVPEPSGGVDLLPEFASGLRHVAPSVMHEPGQIPRV